MLRKKSKSKSSKKNADSSESEVFKTEASVPVEETGASQNSASVSSANKSQNSSSGTSLSVIDSCPDGKCSLPGPARGGYDDGGEFADELFNELNDEVASKVPEQKPLKELLPFPLRISERCLEFGFKLGPETKKASNRELEAGGFYLVEKGDDLFTFKDFIVPKDLPVFAGRIVIAEHYSDAGDEIQILNNLNNTDYRMAAMLHVHPNNAGGLYHSSMDDDALKSLVNKMAKTTRRIYEVPYNLIEDKIRRERGDDCSILKGDELTDEEGELLFGPMEGEVAKSLCRSGFRYYGGGRQRRVV